MESWQSGNAPDSKSGEPSFPWRAGSNPVHSFCQYVEKTKCMLGLFYLSHFLIFKCYTC